MDFMATEEFTRKLFLSSPQPFLRDKTNRFLRLRRAGFLVAFLDDCKLILGF